MRLFNSLGRERLLVGSALVLLSAFLFGVFDEKPPASVGPIEGLSPAGLYELISPSVVTVVVKDEEGRYVGTGSGFVIDKAAVPASLPKNACYVLTNEHVMFPAVQADVQFSDGTIGKVERVVGEDDVFDLALVTVTRKPLRGIPLASADPRILETVYAIGSPQGYIGAASEGKVGSYQWIDRVRWLQTSAPISQGSSGGPLVLPNGTLAGVTTMIHAEGQNLNFAVPVSTVRTFLTTTNFKLRQRSVAEGASIKWHEERALANGMEKEALAFYKAGGESELRKSVRLNPGFAPAHVALARVLLLSEKWREALAECDKAISLMPRCAEAMSLRAQCYFNLGLYELAKSEQENAIELSPANPQLQLILGEMQFETGEYTDAIASYEEAVTLSDNPEAAQHKLARACKASGNLRRAVLEFTRLKDMGFSECDAEIEECMRLQHE